MRKKIDERIRMLMQNCVKARHRGVFVILGDRAKDQIINLYNLWLTIAKSADDQFAQPKLLWCYKTELGFSSHQKKRKKEISKMMRQGIYEKETENPFEIFLNSSDIRYCYYKDTQRILGSSFDILILQDFEALTPNTLCRTIETVKGGGLVFLMLKSMNTLRQLYSMTMDVHSRFRSAHFQDVEPLFNERMILSLSASKSVMFLDDELNLLQVSSEQERINNYTDKDEIIQLLRKGEKDLESLKLSVKDNELVHKIMSLSMTIDQAKVILFMLDSIRNKNLKTEANDLVFIIAGRGRGKSAALGISIAGALVFGLSNIYVTAATPDNLSTVFQFTETTLEALGYKKNMDFELKYNKDNTPLSLTLFSSQEGGNLGNQLRKQKVTYMSPRSKIENGDLLIIDEAAAIPSDVIRPLIMNTTCPLFMSSTVHGYEGTGRSLSLKLVNDIKDKNSQESKNWSLREVEMTVPIRYNSEDPIESWLNNLLCLDATIPIPLRNSLPHANDCSLYFVNKTTLLSYKKTSEQFLKAIWSLFVSSHYKNTPNDLQLLSDAPSHFLAILLGPLDKTSKKSGLPDVLVAMQLCFEGSVNKYTVDTNKNRGVKPSGDMIPWAFSEQFLTNEIFQQLGVRVVRVATHKEAFKLGYGSRALDLLTQFFENKLIGQQKEEMSDFLKNTDKTALKPLLKSIHELSPIKIDYLSVSYGVTNKLNRFWSKNDFKTFYIRQAKNETTGEHSCMMLKPLNNNNINFEFYFNDFRRRFVKLLDSDFKSMDLATAIDIIQPNLNSELSSDVEMSKKDKEMINMMFSPLDIKRLEAYSLNKIEHMLIKDLVPTLAELYFLNKLPSDARLSKSQALILIYVGLQKNSIYDLVDRLSLTTNQINALYNKTIKRLFSFIKDNLTDLVAQELDLNNKEKTVFEPVKLDSDALIGQLVKRNKPGSNNTAGVKKVKSN